MQFIRNDQDLPYCFTKWGWKYHHTGIPTNEKKPGEKYIEHIQMYVSGFSTSPFGIEWMRFEKDSPVHPLIQQVPHVAFVVDDLEKAVKGYELLSDISNPSKGIRVAMIKHNEAPVELMEFF